MDTIQIKDKLFTVSIKEQEIQKEVIRVANEINRDLAGKNPLFLSVLNGSFMFTADLIKHITIPCEISFVKLASYQGVSSTGVIKEVIGINEDISGRTVDYTVPKGNCQYASPSARHFVWFTSFLRPALPFHRSRPIP